MQQAAQLRDVFMDGGMMEDEEKERGKQTEKD